MKALLCASILLVAACSPAPAVSNQCATLSCDPACGDAGVRLDDAGCATCECNTARTCPALGCAPDCGDAGVKTDDAGCATCQCNPAPTCAPLQCDPNCGDAGVKTDDAGCLTCTCNKPIPCNTDSDCQPKQVCVSGACEDVATACAGASIGPMGGCLGPTDAPLPASCCKQPPTKCGDGSMLMCQSAEPTCGMPLIAAHYQGCWACFDEFTCDRQCQTNMDCPTGTVCAADPNDPCNTTADCNRPGYMVCQTPEQTGCMSSADCPPNESCEQGKCVAVDPCAGAMIDAAGSCVDPKGNSLPAMCCTTTTMCGDGSAQLCQPSSTFGCSSPLVEGPYKGCVACFDAKTCYRECTSQMDCDTGTKCLPDPNDPCNQPGIDCFKAGVSVCTPAQMCPPLACDIACPDGYATDPTTGCMTCSCNPTPCNCPNVDAPVCGTDGMTYQNDCFAKCANVGIASMGACGTMPMCPPVACSMMCPYGYATDPTTGCQTCTCLPDPCMCPPDDAPVCGTDGMTYDNACLAKCAGVGVASMGSCTACTVTCTQPTYVCGADGVTYRCGEPDALCHNTTVASQGPCPALCTVTCNQPTWVCGADGVTYRCGEPDALCHNTTVAAEGACPGGCGSVCTNMEPVCGADGNTYGCPDEASCNGITSYTTGACGSGCNVMCPNNAQVCGTDGKTYDCAAETMCAGTGIAHTGACGTPCKTDMDCSSGETCFRPNTGSNPPPPLGECQPPGFCESNADCTLPPPPGPCVGSWTCVSNACEWICAM